MDSMAACFGLPVGFSDHTLGIEISLAAVARGATIIEKHFTLDRTLPGPDHAASLEPNELKQLVSGIRNIESALGSSLKSPSSVEVINRSVARRSLVAVRDISCGRVISTEDLGFKRPGSGLSPMEYWDILGCKAVRDFAADELIER
jgi:sialic acid synthase SpsE